jgi:hypothetical protein
VTNFEGGFELTVNLNLSPLGRYYKDHQSPAHTSPVSPSLVSQLVPGLRWRLKGCGRPFRPLCAALEHRVTLCEAFGQRLSSLVHRYFDEPALDGGAVPRREQC